MSTLAKRIRRLQRDTSEKILFASAEARPGRVLAVRAAIVLGLFAFVTFVLWLDRDGIRDMIDGKLSFVDLIYFVVVSLTTVGYGDIVPVTERARLIDAIIITPARLLVWLVFIGTAFELFFHKGLERIRMARLQKQLTDHVVICGYGHSGRTAAAELVRRGTPPDQIVIVDQNEHLLREAAVEGHIGLKGDATMERVLRDAGVDRASRHPLHGARRHQRPDGPDGATAEPRSARDRQRAGGGERTAAAAGRRRHHGLALADLGLPSRRLRRAPARKRLRRRRAELRRQAAAQRTTRA
jgi:voltage-gated potassium channel Kch